MQALSGIYSKKMSNDKGLIKSFLTQKELDELKGQHVSSHELFPASLHAYRAKAILKLQGVSDIDVKRVLHDANGHDFPSVDKVVCREWNADIKTLTTEIYSVKFIESGLPPNEWLGVAKYLEVSHYPSDESLNSDGHAKDPLVKKQQNLLNSKVEAIEKLVTASTKSSSRKKRETKTASMRHILVGSEKTKNALFNLLFERLEQDDKNLDIWKIWRYNNNNNNNNNNRAN